MPDTIISVAFTSPGAPAVARAGTYPIRPSAIVLQGDARVNYSVRYIPGTMTVAAAGPIAETQKDQFGVPTPNGGVVWALGITPVVGRTLVLFVGSSGVGQAAPGFSVPTTGGDVPYDRVGGAGYKAETLDTVPSVANWVLAAFTHKVDGGDGSESVKVTFTDPGGGGSPNAQLVLVEYQNVAAVPVTAFGKAQVAAASATRPNPLPAVNLDNTTGQCVVAARYGNFGLPGSGGVGPNVQAGFTGRYSMAGTATCDNNDVNVMDRVGLSGFGPETPTYDWTPGATSSAYVGIVLALTKG